MGQHKVAVGWQCDEVEIIGDIDPAAETLYLRLITCHRALGQHAEALAVYRRCRQILATLGVAPSREIEALGQALGGARPPLAT